MWVWLINKAGEGVIDPINANQALNFIDLSPLNGRSAFDCTAVIGPEILYLSPRNRLESLRFRLADAKQHLKSALAKKVSWSERLMIIFESVDILFGQEMAWVPSGRNTVKILGRLFRAASDYPRSTVVVQNAAGAIEESPAATQDAPIEPLPKLTEEAIRAEALQELEIEKLAIARGDTFFGTSPYAAQVEFESKL